MIQNILVEASRGEVVLTSRPRIIALPPLSVPRWGRRGQRPLEGARGGRESGAAGELLLHSPYLGLSVFQDSESRVAAGSGPGATASGDARLV